MERLKLFDRALLGKQILGNSLIVILDIIYLISGVFFGQMDFLFLLRYVLFVNMIATCILFHNLILSRGEFNNELNTEKMIYFPTTRQEYLRNKYAKTLVFLLIQSGLTLVSLWFGYYGNRGHMELNRVLGSMYAMTAGILITSAICVIIMYLRPYALYTSMLFYVPLSFGAVWLEEILTSDRFAIETISILALALAILWGLCLWVGVKVYEHLN